MTGVPPLPRVPVGELPDGELDAYRAELEAALAATGSPSEEPPDTVSTAMRRVYADVYRRWAGR